ncbi:NAD(P)-dependent oxidoreductase [Microbacterium immunditiarum]|uniref:3-hydroxyisobutyrate dehydrogenase/putative dehydrogenase n=1 Tax=Microbacterium immunditiarum TaxID=337480 RepID=A0A7Y9KI51_9MICO|nr:NAD(P)-dependent oxidoreductase [Microbacterium immunditiarum]NYE18400.1 3-hydroxyisobutyrate dehydrogenase/putative dehydrogenase [Microbacterium immunditiarum]
MTALRVGWVGLGAMGGPMARVAVAAGFEVTAFDVDANAVAALAEAGCRIADSPEEAARKADVLVLMVATPAQAEAVLFGEGGAASALRPGAIVLVMATVGDIAVRSWAERLADAGVAVVDAPVSGGVARAAAGELLIMAAGTGADLARVSPLLDALAASAPIVGSASGDGQRMKLVNQLLCGVHIVAAAEALSFAEALGLDQRAAWEVVRSGAAGSFMLDDRGRRMLDEDPPVRSAVDIFVKDMGLVVEAAEAAGHEPSLARAARAVYEAAHDRGLGRSDDSAVIQTYRMP